MGVFMEAENKEKLKQEGWGVLKDVLTVITNRGYNALEIVITDSKPVWDDALLPALEKVKEFAIKNIAKIGVKNNAV